MELVPEGPNVGSLSRSDAACLHTGEPVAATIRGDVLAARQGHNLKHCVKPWRA